MNLNGKTLVITGAAGGIGRALALGAAKRGASLALADIDQAGIDKTRQDLTGLLSDNACCTAHKLNVASLDDWLKFRDTALESHWTIDGIINNAGVTFAGTVENTDYAQLERVMSINFMGMVYGSKEFLSILKTRPEALIANVSSVFGLYPMKNQSAYCSSKFAIRGFTETLAQELRSSNIHVTTIHPGHIGTDIVQNARIEGNIVGSKMSDADQEAWAEQFKSSGMKPEDAAEIILNGIEQRQRKILVGQDALDADEMSRQHQYAFIDTANDASP